jgi:hypothetical protein
MPSGAGRGRRTKQEAVKALFRAAVNAVVRRDPDAPKPETRRRQSGGTESGAPIMRAQLRRTRPAARGRYAVLQAAKTKAGKIARRFTRAATDAAAAPEAYEDAALAFADTLAQLHRWNDEALAEDFDGPGPARHTCVTFDP